MPHAAGDISAYNLFEGSSSEKVHRDMQPGSKLMALVERSTVIILYSLPDSHLHLFLEFIYSLHLLSHFLDPVACPLCRVLQ